MYIIAGLGNPGKEYEGTRHNTGFMVLDKIAERYNIEIKKEKNKALIGSGEIYGTKVILIKPQTYMNLSGVAASAVLNFYKEPIENFIAIFDDLDLPVGKIRIKERGSAGTHNGVKSLVNELGTEDFKRVKVGIGSSNSKIDMINFVLGKFTDEEKREIEKSTDMAMDAVIKIVSEGISRAMNEFN